MWRMIIADDEEIECRGLEMMIQNNFKNIELIPSVYNGVDLLKSVERFRPDLMIVDINMPGLTGLEAIEILRMKSVDTKVIINTAYSDFAYSQKAIRLGASDFLVKPVDESQLVEAISRVIDLIEQERKNKKNSAITEKKFRDMQKIVGNELMSSILLGKPNEEGFRLWFDNLGRTYLGGVLVAVKTADNTKQSMHLEKIQKYAEEQLKRFSTSLSVIYKGILYLFLLPGGQIGEDNYQQWVRELLEMLQKKIMSEVNCEVVFGISRWKYEFDKMPEALKECRISFNNQAVGVIHFFEQDRYTPIQKIYEEEKTGEMVDAIKEDCREKGRAILQQKIAEWQEAGLGEWQECSLIIDFLQKCAEILSVQGVHHFYWRRLLNRLKKSDSDKVMIEDVLDVLWEMAEQQEPTETRNVYVEEAILYIEQNYMKDISLESLAGRLGISSFYLSRLLTQQLDESFIELLTDTRINHAIELIRSDDFSVKDIGSRVGYLSPTYFYKVFKKNTGMTVGEMRKLLKDN